MTAAVVVVVVVAAAAAMVETAWRQRVRPGYRSNSKMWTTFGGGALGLAVTATERSTWRQRRQRPHLDHRKYINYTTIHADGYFVGVRAPRLAFPHHTRATSRCL